MGDLTGENRAVNRQQWGANQFGFHLGNLQPLHCDVIANSGGYWGNSPNNQRNQGELLEISSYKDIEWCLLGFTMFYLVQSVPSFFVVKSRFFPDWRNAANVGRFRFKSWCQQNKRSAWDHSLLVYHHLLVGGLEHFLLFHILGIIIPTD